MNLNWDKKELTPQKIGKFCEYYAKMTLASYGMAVYTCEVDDHGIDFIAESKIGFLKFQVKSAFKAKYVFQKERYFDINDNSLYLILLLLSDGKIPSVYIIPTSAWKTAAAGPFVCHHYGEREYGINISDKNMAELNKYSIENMIDKII